MGCHSSHFFVNEIFHLLGNFGLLGDVLPAAMLLLSTDHLRHELVELVIAVGLDLLEEVVHFQGLSVA